MEVRLESDAMSTALTVLPTRGYNETIREVNIYKYIKRIIDIIIASVGLIVLSPLFLVIAILIKIGVTRASIFWS